METSPMRFNSRSRVGSDVEGLRKRVDALEFQFTFPCRERPPELLDAILKMLFQFTLPCRERPPRGARRGSA